MLPPKEEGNYREMAVIFSCSRVGAPGKKGGERERRERREEKKRERRRGDDNHDRVDVDEPCRLRYYTLKYITK